MRICFWGAFSVFRVWAAPNKQAKGYPFAVLANRKAADFRMIEDCEKRRRYCGMVWHP
jgi:hypothetical protein